jgi:adenosine kinase
VVLGNVLLDIITPIYDDNLLTKYGLQPDSTTLAEEKHFPIFDEIQNGQTSSKTTIGGSAANTARIAQVCNICKYCIFYNDQE